MKKAFLLTLFFLSACTSYKEIHYSGVGDQWQVEYHAEIVGNKSQRTSFVITYMGQYPKPKKMTYQIQSDRFSHTGSSSTDRGIQSINRDGLDCQSCKTLTKDTDIQAKIWSDGRTEVIDLDLME
ncbi:hypothetical protein [Halobacillus litoralis]|uniref:hypothetical protein n=1 Tax=Halobacillus litoralis TaxID=45668 RepID=UPI001CFD3984|nr:hypothetical protein [Halobacillus litoralis]